MALTDGNGLSAADVAAVMGNGNNGFGFGNDGAWWLIILFLFFMNNGWGNNGGNYGVNPVQNGFDQQAVMNSLAGINTAVSNGFANAEVSRCNAQANTLQALNGISMSLQNCCCENRAATADLKYTVANEGSTTRAAIQSGIQTVLDKLCQQELDALKAQNANLQTQVNLANMQASQTAQTAKILADNAAQTQALEQYLNPVPVPAYMVQNPNCCGPNWYSNCGCNSVA